MVSHRCLLRPTPRLYVSIARETIANARGAYRIFWMTPIQEVLSDAWHSRRSGSMTQSEGMEDMGQTVPSSLSLQSTRGGLSLSSCSSGDVSSGPVCEAAETAWARLAWDSGVLAGATDDEAPRCETISDRGEETWHSKARDFLVYVDIDGQTTKEFNGW